MWLSHSNNHIFENVRNLSYDKSKIKITRVERTNRYVLYWTNPQLWGKSFAGREFVLYVKLKLFEQLPDFLIDHFLDNPLFVQDGRKVRCKTIGRYDVVCGGKKCILDVVFPDSDYTGTEYLTGTKGVCSGWSYDITDASMKEFVMEKIGELHPCDRTFIHIIRHLMSSFSSENSETALIEGKWGGIYRGGKDPVEWTHTGEIFKEWSLTKRPVKYGQCWIFSECLTCVMRFLNVPARTIYAENSHINPSLTSSIDFFEELPLTKSDSTKNSNLFRKIPNMQSFLSLDNKSEPWEKCSFYDCDDSVWNIHYWNEFYIPENKPGSIKFDWECADITPAVVSQEEPKSGNKILGPCQVSSLITGNNRYFDFVYLNSSVNSPFRLWAKDTVVSEGEAITVPYLRTIVYPFYSNNSVGPGAHRSSLFVSKQVKVMTEISGFTRSNITDRYKMPFPILKSLLDEGTPIFFKLINDKLVIRIVPSDEMFYIQQVSLDIYGSIISLKRQTCKLEEVTPISYCSKTKFLSFLVIHGDDFWVNILVV